MNFDYDMIGRQENGRMKGLILSGGPGIGKTHAVMAIVRPGDEFARIAAAGKTKEDFTTYPIPEKVDGDWVIAQPITESSLIPLLEKNIGDGYAVLLIDDVTAADASVQSALLELVQFGRIGDKQLGKNVLIAMTGNGINDGAYAVPWSSALVGRSHFIEYKPNFKHWMELDCNKNADPVLVGFLKENPQFFAPSRGNPADVKKCFDENDIGPSPRQWSDLADSFMAKWGGIKHFQGNIMFPSSNDYAKSLIGASAAQSLMTYASVMLKYPSAEEMMNDPSAWNRLPLEDRNQKGAVYAVAHSIRQYASMMNAKINEKHNSPKGTGKAVEKDKMELLDKFCHAIAPLMSRDREMGAFCTRFLLQKAPADDSIKGLMANYVYGINNDPVLREAKFHEILDEVRKMGEALNSGR